MTLLLHFRRHEFYEAKESLKEIVENYSYARWYDCFLTSIAELAGVLMSDVEEKQWVIENIREDAKKIDLMIY